MLARSALSETQRQVLASASAASQASAEMLDTLLDFSRIEAAVRLRCPDVVISDYRLRGPRTGADAIAAVRAEAGRAVPALLVTGDTAPDRLREAAASGVPLLHKPVGPTDLYNALARALAA